MFDLYALPEDFPGAQEIKTISDPYEQVACLEERLAEDMDHPGFIPYIYPIVVKVEDAADTPAAGSPLRYDKALRVRL